MSTATSITISAEAAEAAKAIAKADSSVWRSAKAIGADLAANAGDASDKAERSAYYDSLAASLSYGPHKVYWAQKNATGRNRATVWASAYAKAVDLGLDLDKLAEASFPSREAVAAFVKLAVNGKQFAKAIADGQPFTVPTVAECAGISKATRKPITKADRKADTADVAVTDDAKAEAKAIVAEAKDDAKAVTLGRMVHWIAEQADAEMLKAITKAVKQAERRIAAAEAV